MHARHVLVPLALAVLAGCSTVPRITAVPAVTNAVSPTPGVVASGRVANEDVARLRDAGIVEVIDLSVDSETPDFAEADAVRAAGMRYVNLPLRGGADLTRENVEAFDRLLRAAPRPVLVHCASGNRVGAMAALRAAWLDHRSTDEAIAIGRAWGLKGLEGAVREKLAAPPISR